MEPPPARRMAGMLCLTERKTPSTLIAICRRQSASVMSTMLVMMPMPAFETSTSSRPKRCSAAATTSAQRSSSVTSWWR